VRRAVGWLAALAGGISLAGPAALASPVGAAGAAGPVSASPSASPGANSFGIRLVDVPVSEAPDSRAWRYIIDNLHPGMMIHRRVEVENMTSDVARVRVYPDAATITGGGFVGDRGQTPSDLTTWTSVSRPTLTLAPGASAMDTVTIRVPRDAPQGERYGVIWAQETAQVQKPRKFTVTEVNRVGVRVYLSIGPGGGPATNFAISSVTAGRLPDGSPEVLAQVRDTGGRAIDLGGNLKLADGPGGASAGPFAFQSGLTLAPGQSGVMRAVLSKATPTGTWHVTVTLQSGVTTRQARATLELLGQQPTGLVLPARSLAIGGIILAIVAVAAWFLARRNRWRIGLRRI
jgi:hypothetical protein